MPVTISSNASGSGTFTLQNPASASNRTVTLPDATTTLMGVDTPVTQSQLSTALNVSGSAPIYACRAWVNFNGTGTVAIRASGNVSSITDNGTGDYTVNFTTAMPDANYAAMITGNTDIPAGSDYGVIPVIHPTVAQTTSSVRILCQFTGNGTLYDLSQVNVAIFR